MTEKTERNIKTIRTILMIMLILGVLALSKVSGNVSTRILLSFFIFILVLPFVTAMEKARIPSFVATLLAVLAIVIFIVFFMWFIFFTVDMLIRKIPQYSDRINDLDGLLKQIASRWIEIPEEASFFSTLQIDWVGGIIMPALRSISGHAINILKDTMIIILMTVFLLGERKVIIPKLLNLTTTKEEEKVGVLWDRIVKQVSKYISIKVFVSIITGVLFYAICIIVKLDFAILWGVMAVILNFIPTIGSILITVLVILMSIVQFAPNLGPILFVAIGTILVQNVIGNILDPRLSGNSLNLSPFIILVGLALFGYIWGITGMFIAVPILSIIQIICANIDELRPVAMFVSSGHSYKKQAREKPVRRRSQKKNGRASDHVQYSDDFMFPDRPTVNGTSKEGTSETKAESVIKQYKPNVGSSSPNIVGNHTINAKEFQNRESSDSNKQEVRDNNDK